ncbi:MAG: hypothetical protein RBT03_02030 [Kiritimatiellia bacterium]|nr:hypothetical protein [Kiritimatiellia bacterium]
MIKRIYKKIIPAGVRNFIAGHPWVERHRNRQLVREGQRLAAAAQATRKPDGKIRVTFIVQRPALWCNHASIYEAMQADPAFDVSVIAIPKRPPAAAEVDLAEYARLKAFLKEKSIPFLGGYDESAQAWINPLTFGLPDIVFLPQPYSFTQSYMYGGDYLSQFVKIAYVHYGIPMANLPEAQYLSPFYPTCWRIFVESDAHRSLFEQHAPNLADRLVVTGHPKTDTYLHPPRCVGLWKLAKANKRIIWAPHFTVSRDKTPHAFSNFFEYYDFFIRCAAMHPDVEFVLRPHPELFRHMVAAGLKTREEADNFRDRFNTLPNGQVYEGGDIFELFKESDALILDSLGFLAEYLPTRKPICFLENPRRQRLNVIGETLLSVYYQAWNIHDIEIFIEDVVVGEQDWMKDGRLTALQAHLHLPETGSGVAIMEYIRNNETGC